MAAITSFQAKTLKGGEGLRFQWDFSADLISHTTPNMCKEIYLYLNKQVLTDGVVRQVQVIPLLTGGVLTTTFDVSGLEIGTTYVAQIEVTVETPAGIQVYTKSATGKTSTIPPKPKIIVGQNRDSGFYVQLTNSSSALIAPQKNSSYDGYSPLTGLYVVYADGTQMYTKYIDASGDELYTEKLQVAAPFEDYEIAVSIANDNGRSELSDSQVETVDTSIRGPKVVHIVEEMAMDPSASATYSSGKYTNPRMLLAWNAPENLGNPELDKYRIMRSIVTNGVTGNFTQVGSDLPLADVIAYKTDLSYNVDASYVYIDTSVNEGMTYKYNILGVNTNGVGLDAIIAGTLSDLVKDKTVRAVTWPSVNSFETSPGNSRSDIDVSMNGGFLDSDVRHTYDISYSSVAGSGLDSAKSKPLSLTGLTNNVPYKLQVRGNMVSPNVVNKTYTSDYSTSKDTTPINVLPPVENLTATPLDASGNNPLNGKVTISWTNPTDVSSFSGIQYRVERKLFDDVDPSYVFDISAALVAGSNVSLDRPSLTNGTKYTYRVITSFYNDEVQKDYESVAQTVSVMPFNNPEKPASVVLTSINSTSDLSFSLLDFSSNMNWGVPIVGHRYTLYNRNNGGEVQVGQPVDVEDSSFVLVPKRALLSTLFGSLNAGTRYALDVQSFIKVNGVKHYSTKIGTNVVVSSLPNNWTKPSGITNITVTNVDNSKMPLSTGSGATDGKIRLSWEYPESQDASSMTFRVINKVFNTFVSGANLAARTFDITGISVGTLSQTFFVRSILNEAVSAIVSDAGKDVNGTPIYYPDKVSSVTVDVSNSTTVNYKFNGVAYHGGMVAANTQYYVELLEGINVKADATINHATGLLSGSFSGLVAGTSYTIRVTTNALNPMVAGQYIDSETSETSANFTPYDLPINVTGFEVNPADRAIVVKWVPIVNVPAGLTFDSYTIEHKRSSDPDASYSSVNISPQTLSVYSITGLTNSLTYDVRIKTNFKDTLDVVQSSNYATKLQAVPNVSPATPNGLQFQLDSTGAGGTIFWDIPSPTAIPVPTHYSIVIEGSGNNYFFELDHIQISDPRFTVDGSKLKYTLASGLLLGNNYVIRLYSEVEKTLLNTVYYSSSTPNEYSFQSYKSADAPLVTSIRAKLGNESIQVEWDLPSNTGGQGNSLEYIVYLSKTVDASTNPIKLAGLQLVDKDNNTITPTAAGSNQYRLTSLGGKTPLQRLPLTFTNAAGQTSIVNKVEHKFYVCSIFTISSTDYPSAVVTKDKLYPRPSPVDPTMTAVVIDNSGIQLNISSDASFNLEGYKLYRQIQPIDGSFAAATLIDEQVYTSITGAAGSVRPWSVFDTKIRAPTNTNWLEGNTIRYYVEATYNDNNINPQSGTNGDEIRTSTTYDRKPLATIFPCDISGNPLTPAKVALMSEPDASNNLYYYVNKAGSDLNSVDAVILDASNVVVMRWSGTDTVVGGITVTPVTNAQIPGVTAKKQVAKVRINLTNDIKDNLSDIIAVNANSTGSCVAIYPQNGVFSNLK